MFNKEIYHHKDVFKKGMGVGGRAGTTPTDGPIATIMVTTDGNKMHQK